MSTEKSDSLKFNKNIQPVEKYSETVEIFVPLFHIGGPESLIKFIIFLHKIMKGQDLSTGPQIFGMTWNLVVGKALWMFKKKAQERVDDKNANYFFVMKDLVSYFFLPEALQIQKRYLGRAMYKPRNTKIKYIICRINDTVKYLENFPPFGSGQRLPEGEILKLVEFSLPN